MGRTFRIIALAAGLGAFIILAVFGFAIWVFLPLLPAGIIYVFAVVTLRRRQHAKPAAEMETERRKAA